MMEGCVKHTCLCFVELFCVMSDNKSDAFSFEKVDLQINSQQTVLSIVMLHECFVLFKIYLDIEYYVYVKRYPEKVLTLSISKNVSKLKNY